MRDGEIRLSVETDQPGDVPELLSLDQLLNSNRHDPDLCAALSGEIRGAEVGSPVVFGGGAAPLWTIVRRS